MVDLPAYLFTETFHPTTPDIDAVQQICEVNYIVLHLESVYGEHFTNFKEGKLGCRHHL
jgi:hypothetical protein